MSFPRDVIFEACNFLGRAFGFHGQFEDMILRWGLDQFEERGGAAVHQRFRTLFKYIRDNPAATALDGRRVSDLVVEEAASRVSPLHEAHEFTRALERAGYVIQDRRLRRTLPDAIDLPAADDEVHTLLKRHDQFRTPLGHLDQAIENHARGSWAAANSQLRSFLESLLDEIAYTLVPSAPRGPGEGEARREALAKLERPFLSPALNEWGNSGKNLLNGVFKRLHPEGAHPGLSDEEDSTFRLHLVLVISRLLLRRFESR